MVFRPYRYVNLFIYTVQVIKQYQWQVYVLRFFRRIQMLIKHEI